VSGDPPGDRQADVDALFVEYRRSHRRRVRNQLVEAHMGFAHHIARRFVGRGIAEEDVRQVALLGLVKAVDRFDPDHGAAFTSFAGRTIEGEIKRHFRDAAWSVRVPRSIKEMHLLVRAATDELNQSTGRSPTPREVAAHLDVDVDTVVEALGASAAFRADSLDPGPGDDGAADRSSALASTDTGLTDTAERVVVEGLLESLPEREREIVRLRFFDELTQSEIADRVGVSQMHVSRLLRRSITLMRRAAEA
jgi:RNA polymerase sigma-B factor